VEFHLKLLIGCRRLVELLSQQTIDVHEISVSMATNRLSNIRLAVKYIFCFDTGRQASTLTSSRGQPQCLLEWFDFVCFPFIPACSLQHKIARNRSKSCFVMYSTSETTWKGEVHKTNNMTTWYFHHELLDVFSLLSYSHIMQPPCE